MAPVLKDRAFNVSLAKESFRYGILAKIRGAAERLDVVPPVQVHHLGCKTLEFTEIRHAVEGEIDQVKTHADSHCWSMNQSRNVDNSTEAFPTVPWLALH